MADAWRPAPLLWWTAGVHVVGVLVWAAEPAWWRWVAGVLLLHHLAVAVAGMWPRSRLLGPNLVRLPPETGSRLVALTFDDGPDPEVTPRVLEMLESHRARASFFCIGHRAERHPEIVAEIVRRGHRLENHTYRHSNAFAFYTPGAMAAEIDRAQSVLTELGGRRPAYFRAPAGIRNPWLDPILHRRGLVLASWSRRGFDTVERNPARVQRRLLRGLAAGDVLLLHDGSAALAHGGVPVVLEVLPRLLEALTARGLEPGPLPDPPLPPGS